ncbi:MAG: type II toxin-antitoxin system VapC family toxin [Acidobacteriia bacterium]|nr:type II toxin-antitoxin system VapC family toxin [Terriglobia bacterium]
MKALLDTHALLWWLSDDPALSARARRAITAADNEIFVSAASAWEMAIKNKRGKLDIQNLLDRLPQEIEEEGFLVLPISIEHGLRAGALPEHHRDPFDRMLIAQAQAEQLPIVSNDTVFDSYGIKRIW